MLYLGYNTIEEFVSSATAARQASLNARAFMPAGMRGVKSAQLALEAAKTALFGMPEKAAIMQHFERLKAASRAKFSSAAQRAMGDRWRNLNLMYIQALPGPGPAQDAYMSELSAYNAQYAENERLRREFGDVSRQWMDLLNSTKQLPEYAKYQSAILSYREVVGNVNRLEKEFKDRFNPPAPPSQVMLRLDPTPENIDRLALEIQEAKDRRKAIESYLKANRVSPFIGDLLRREIMTKINQLVMQSDDTITRYQALPARPGAGVRPSYETTKQRAAREKAYIADLTARIKDSQLYDRKRLRSGEITLGEYNSRMAYRTQMQKVLRQYRLDGTILSLADYVPFVEPQPIVVPPPKTITPAPVATLPEAVIAQPPVPAPDPVLTPTPVPSAQPVIAPAVEIPTGSVVPASEPVQAPTPEIATAPVSAPEPVIPAPVTEIATPVTGGGTTDTVPVQTAEVTPVALAPPTVSPDAPQPTATPLTTQGPVPTIQPEAPATTPEQPSVPITTITTTTGITPVELSPPTTTEQTLEQPVAPVTTITPEATVSPITLEPPSYTPPVSTQRTLIWYTGGTNRFANIGETQESFDASGVYGSKSYVQPVGINTIDSISGITAARPETTTEQGVDMALLDYYKQVPGYELPQGQSSQSPLTPVPSNESYVDPELATVEGRTANLLKSGNPLLEQAKAASERASNQRGLLNSTAAVQAGVGATMDKALQITTPDAALYGNMAQASQKTGLEGSLNNQLAEIERKKYENNALITGSLAKQDIQGRRDIQVLADNAAAQRIQLENEWKDYLSASQYDSAETQALMQSAGAMGQELTGSIERLLRDTNITNKTDAIAALMTQYKSQLNTVAATAGIALVWS